MKVEHFYNYGSYNEIHGNEVVNLSIEGKHVKVNGKDISGIAYLFVCASLVGFSLWKAYSFAESQRQKIITDICAMPSGQSPVKMSLWS